MTLDVGSRLGHSPIAEPPHQEPAFSMSNIVLRPPTSSTTAAKRRTPVEDRSGLDVPAGLDDRSSPADRAPVRPTSRASMSG